MIMLPYGSEIFPFDKLLSKRGKKITKKNKQVGSVVEQERNKERMKTKQKKQNFQKNFLQKH